ncbi:MAG TPA: radical SAM protein, partial [Methylomirabilota bacterium]|nr:radical SAM protein [Methylomirabilota bacterium]
HEAGDHQADRGWAPPQGSRPVARWRERVSETPAQPHRPDAASRSEKALRLEKLSFVVPSRAKLPALKQYAHLERDGRLELVGYVEASRGCKHLCRHCPIPPVYGGRFFVVPGEIVLADIRQLVGAGARHVTFGDPDFLNGPRHAMTVARALHQEFPDLTFDFTAKVEHLLRHRALLPELAGLGAIFVVSAVESLSDTVLANLAKGHTRADVAAVLEAVRAAGIAFRPTWVPFTPWATLEDYRELLAFVADEGLIDHVDAVQYSIRLLVPPGSLLLDSPAMRPHLGPLVADGFYYRWTHPDPRVDQLQEAVGRMVAETADRREDAAVTFARVRALADATAGLPARPAPPPLASDRPRPPRLTEPWFC